MTRSEEAGEVRTSLEFGFSDRSLGGQKRRPTRATSEKNNP